MSGISNTLIYVGVGLVAIGLLARLGLMAWFGNLPGDIRIENDRTTVFIPITSMIVVSVVATIIVNVLGRWSGE